MSGVSPSLVEAAARALFALRGTERWYAELGRGRRPREVGELTLLEMEAEAVLAAVGNALRLEGAQAEHARIEKALTDANRIGGPYALQAFEEAYKREAGIDGPFTCPSAVIQGCAAINRRAFDAVLDALGGVSDA